MNEETKAHLRQQSPEYDPEDFFESLPDDDHLDRLSLDEVARIAQVEAAQCMDPSLAAEQVLIAGKTRVAYCRDPRRSPDAPRKCVDVPCLGHVPDGLVLIIAEAFKWRRYGFSNAGIYEFEMQDFLDTAWAFVVAREQVTVQGEQSC